MMDDLGAYESELDAACWCVTVGYQVITTIGNSNTGLTSKEPSKRLGTLARPALWLVSSSWSALEKVHLPGQSGMHTVCVSTCSADGQAQPGWIREVLHQQAGHRP